VKEVLEGLAQFDHGREIILFAAMGLSRFFGDPMGVPRGASFKTQAALLVAVAAAPLAGAEEPLASGSQFPVLAGRSLIGTDVTVKADGESGRVFVISFSQDAARPAKAWLDACRAAPPAASPSPPAPAGRSVPSAPPAAALPRPVVCYDVRMMQGAPRLLRGFIEGRMRKGEPASRHANTVLLYRDEELWRDRFAVIEDKKDQPYIAFVDAQGRVSTLTHGPWDQGLFERERARLEKR
jgi:hypothetical protein